MNYEDRVTKEYVENAVALAAPKIAGGRYTGTGDEEYTMALGFTPKVVFIFPFNGEMYESKSSERYYYGGIIGENQPLRDTGDNDGEYITTGGFVVMNKSFVTDPITHWPRTNVSSFPYYYLAIG